MEVTPELERVCKTIAKCVQRHMAQEENRRRFELWYEQTYGKKYEWKEKSY